MKNAAPGEYVWWLAGRSAGIVALLLITCSVLLGLAMAARAISPRRRGRAMRLHQHLALLSLGAIAAHGLLLAADPWLRAGAKGILVPFAMGYRPLWTGLGILGGYLAAILGLSFYLRRRIGARLWRRMHRFTVLVYVLSLVHAVGAGTDASIPAVRYAMLASALPVLFLFALRLQRVRRDGGAPRRQVLAPPITDPEGRAARGRAAITRPMRAPATARPGARHMPGARCRLDPHPSQRS